MKRSGSGDRDTLLRTTVPRSPDATSSAVVVATGSLSPVTTMADRYPTVGALGAGGMGEVKLVRDVVVGRDVALKSLLGPLISQPDAAARFVIEARIQGQLEHPSIVPVHDLGLMPDGRPDFTMKRVRGQTLDDVLELRRSGAADAHDQYAERRLLTAFVSVCLAIELAHSRGVVHRDLKPSNIMFGDFGEVYVLDWGIARVVDVPDSSASSPAPALSDLPRVAATARGALVGTPGYMAPEQVRGEIDAIGPRADVYALGAVLFEILTLEPLHEGPDVLHDLDSTLKGADARIRARFPDLDVAPELEAICVRATALEPADRFASPREMADLIDRYLDGDRNAALRKELAETHAERAAELTRSALASADIELRRRALHEASQALGLDPTSPSPRRTIVSLLTSPPAEVPPEAQAALDRTALEMQVLSSKMGAVAYGAWAVLSIPAAAWMGVRSLPLFAAFLALQLLAFIACVLAARAKTVAAGVNVLSTFTAIGANAALNFAFGPLVLLPTAAAATMTLLLLHPRLPHRGAVIASACGTFLVPWMLELAGVWSSAYDFQGGQMIVHPRMLFLPAMPTLLVLACASLATFGVLGVSVSRVRRLLSDAESRLQVLSWQLQQLVE